MRCNVVFSFLPSSFSNLLTIKTLIPPRRIRHKALVTALVIDAVARHVYLCAFGDVAAVDGGDGDFWGDA